MSVAEIERFTADEA